MARMSWYSRVSDMIKITYPLVMGEGFLETKGFYISLKVRYKMGTENWNRLSR